MRAQNTEQSPAIQLTREPSVTDCGRTETKPSPNSRPSAHFVRGKGGPRGQNGGRRQATWPKWRAETGHVLVQPSRKLNMT